MMWYGVVKTKGWFCSGYPWGILIFGLGFPIAPVFGAAFGLLSFSLPALFDIVVAAPYACMALASWEMYRGGKSGKAPTEPERGRAPEKEKEKRGRAATPEPRKASEKDK